MTTIPRPHRLAAAAAAAALAALVGGAASAQVAATFEQPDFAAAWNGVTVSGQGEPDWFIPTVGGNDALVYVASGNSLGMIANCQGGAQFLAAQRRAGGFTRAEIGSSVSDELWGPDGTSGLVRLQYDFNCIWQDIGIGDPAAPGVRNNLASISIQPYPLAGVSLIYQWENPEDPGDLDQTYRIGITGFFADGTQSSGAVVQFPGTALQGLVQNHWYRITAELDLDLNVVTSLTLCGLTTDLPPGVPASVQLGPGTTGAMWYLGGGASGNGPVVGLRLFAGGGSGGSTGAGNTIAIDNLITTPNPNGSPACVPCGAECGEPCPSPGCNDGGIDCDLNNDCRVDLPDLASMLFNFGGVGSCMQGDVDGDGRVELDDLAQLLLRFGRDCSDPDLP